jgi:hypothetical protein
MGRGIPRSHNNAPRIPSLRICLRAINGGASPVYPLNFARNCQPQVTEYCRHHRQTGSGRLRPV